MAAALLVVCAFGLAVRLWGIGYLLPFAIVGDGSVLVTQVELLRAGADPARPVAGSDGYPLLLARAAALLPSEDTTDDAPASLTASLRRAAAPWRDLRLVSVLLSMLAVPATWSLARRFLGARWAVLAAAFFATSLLHADFSAQERPHGAATTFIAIAVLGALRLRERPDVRAYLLAGLTAGLAIGTLQSGLSVLPAFAVALVLRERGPRRASLGWSLASLLIVAVLVRWLYPFYFSGRPVHVDSSAPGDSVANVGGHEVHLGGFDGTGFWRIATSLCFWDPILTAAALAGSACLAARALRARTWDRRARDAAVVAAHALPYLFVTGMYTFTLERFLMPLLPVLACLAAYGVRAAVDALAPRRALAGVRAGLAVALPALAALPVVQLARLHGAETTNDIAGRWLGAHAGADDAIVVIPYVEVPLFQDEATLARNLESAPFSRWTAHQSRMSPAAFGGPRHRLLIAPPSRVSALRRLAEDPARYFAEHDARYVLLGLFGSTTAVLSATRDALRRDARLVLRVLPERVDSGTSPIVAALHADEGPAPSSRFRRPYGLCLFDYERMGPTLELYAFD